MVLGINALTTKGKPVKHRKDDSSLLTFEKTTTLITTGIFHYIRHPMYSSLLWLAWGVFFKHPDWPGGILALAASLFLIIAARVEEAESIRFFGAPYQDYIKQTKMFVPFLV